MRKFLISLLICVITLASVSFSACNFTFWKQTVKFGSFPQSKVTDEGLTKSLNGIASDSAWISYNYYIEKSNEEDYMWYQDVEYNENKYRGVYFTSYRPAGPDYPSDEENSMQDDYGYRINSKETAYWFQWEPLEWTVLEKSGGTEFLLCNTILTAQDYYPTERGREQDGKTTYANNYEYSAVRAWLLEDFYEIAFSEAEKKEIQTTEVDNGVRSTNPYENATRYNNGENKYACQNTRDKVFLLSSQEATNPNYGFSTENRYDEAKFKKASDYAQCQGCSMQTLKESKYYGCGSWWLRSSAYNYGGAARFVNGAGYPYMGISVALSTIGIVPALRKTV